MLMFLIGHNLFILFLRSIACSTQVEVIRGKQVCRQLWIIAIKSSRFEYNQLCAPSREGAVNDRSTRGTRLHLTKIRINCMFITCKKLARLTRR